MVARPFLKALNAADAVVARLARRRRPSVVQAVLIGLAAGGAGVLMRLGLSLAYAEITGFFRG
jgi:hypothetical protein